MALLLHARQDAPSISMSADGVREDFERHLRLTLVKDRYTATDRDRYYALALTVRDRLIERWSATQQMHHTKNVKRVYYLSLEFLIGRLLGNNVINLQLENSCNAAMSDLASTGKIRATTKLTQDWATEAWAAWPLVFSILPPP